MTGSKKWLLNIVLTCLSIGGASHADVALKLTLKESCVLQYEQVWVDVKVTNLAAAPLVVDERLDTRIWFRIRRGRDVLAERLREDLPLGTLVLTPGESREARLDLSLWYDLGTPDRYLVAVILDWEGKTFVSNEVVVDVVPGIELVKVSKPVPGHPEKIRHYTLRYWTRGGREQLFIRVDEQPSHLNYGVFHLGGLVRLRKPMLAVDSEGNIEVVHQNAPGTIVHTFLKSEKERVFLKEQRQEVIDERFERSGEPSGAR